MHSNGWLEMIGEGFEMFQVTPHVECMRSDFKQVSHLAPFARHNSALVMYTLQNQYANLLFE